MASQTGSEGHIKIISAHFLCCEPHTGSRPLEEPCLPEALAGGDDKAQSGRYLSLMPSPDQPWPALTCPGVGAVVQRHFMFTFLKYLQQKRFQGSDPFPVPKRNAKNTQNAPLKQYIAVSISDKGRRRWHFRGQMTNQHYVSNSKCNWTDTYKMPQVLWYSSALMRWWVVVVQYMRLTWMLSLRICNSSTSCSRSVRKPCSRSERRYKKVKVNSEKFRINQFNIPNENYLLKHITPKHIFIYVCSIH